MKKNRIGYILSYKDPEYIRTRVLKSAIKKLSKVEYHQAVNSTKSLLRYPQTVLLTLWMRLRYRPDVYILGFRGHEIFWPIRLLTIGKPLIFDEFINTNDWLVNEHGKVSEKSFRAKAMRLMVKTMLASSQLILTDTRLASEYSSDTYGISINKYAHIYVGESDGVFKPSKSKINNTHLEVFFYGNMAPLHGVMRILEAANRLKAEKVHFTIIGGLGNNKKIDEIKGFIKKNQLERCVEYIEWAPLIELPGYVEEADLCLGGPFGDTSQSKRVITGKTFQFLASEKPVVIGKINEDVGFIDKENCILVKQGSTEEIVKSLQWAAKNRTKLRKIGRAGKDLYDRRFSVEAASKKVEQIIKRVV